MLCQECSKKDTCVELCREAEGYVSQDHVSQRDLPVGFPDFPSSPLRHLAVKFTTVEHEMVTLLGGGVSRGEVCKHLNITRHSLRQHLYRIRKKYMAVTKSRGGDKNAE